MQFWDECKEELYKNLLENLLKSTQIEFESTLEVSTEPELIPYGMSRIQQILSEITRFNINKNIHLRYFHLEPTAYHTVLHVKLEVEWEAEMHHGDYNSWQ